MPPTYWYTLARLVADHEGWEQQKEQLEDAIRRAVAEADERHAEVIFAAWTTLASGVKAYYYQTSSRAVWDRFRSPLPGGDPTDGK